LRETTGYHLPSSGERAGVDAPRSAPGTPRSFYALACGADSIPEGLALHLGSPGHYGQDYVPRRAVEREAIGHTGDDTPTLSECFDNRKRVADTPPRQPVDTENVNLDKLPALCTCL
jgi:hypothetical protein